MDKSLILTRLMSSKICHDLISPAQAASLGIEELSQMDEISTSESPEGIDLVLRASKIMLARVSFFRMAIGNASIGDGYSGIIKAKRLVHDLFKEFSVDINWKSQDDTILLQAASSENIKLLLNIFLIAFYCTSNSVDIKLLFADIGDNIGVAVEINGNSVKIMDSKALEAIRLEISEEDLDANYVHNYFTGLMAKELGAMLEIRESTAGVIQLAVSLPKVDKAVLQVYQQSAKLNT